MDALKKMGRINLQPHAALGTRFQTSTKNINALFFKALMCMFLKNQLQSLYSFLSISVS